MIVGIPDKFYWSTASYNSTVEEYKPLGYRFKKNQNRKDIRNNPLARLFSNKMKSNQISYVYIPDLIEPDTYIDDWFYSRDMHINTKGNQKISELLKTRGL